MKRLLLLLFVALGFNLNAQSLLNEDSSTLTIGNVGADLTGLVAGQGGWTTFIASTAVPAGQNSDFQVVDKGGSYGNAIQIIGPSSTTGTRWMEKNIAAEWTARTPGNNIAEMEYEFFTGPVTTSKNTMRLVFYESQARLKMLAGLMIIMDTKELRALGYLDPVTLGGTGAVGNYSLTLGGTAVAPEPLILLPDTWYKIGISFNNATGEIKFKEVNGLLDRTYAGAATTENVGEIAILGAAGGTTAAPNTASSTGIYDNIVARASATDTLLLSVATNELVDNNVIVFPNPANSIVSVTTTDILIDSIELTDINGRTIKNVNSIGSNESQINVSDLAQGIYMMKITSDKGVAIKKIIKE